MPVPLRAVRQPDRRAAADPCLPRAQRPPERPDQLPHRGALVRRRDPELVHDAVVSAVPADEHHGHGGWGEPPGPAGVLSAAMPATRRPIPMAACAGDASWYLNGRPFGNSGPGRRLRRESRTPAGRRLRRRRHPPRRARRQLGRRRQLLAVAGKPEPAGRLHRPDLPRVPRLRRTRLRRRRHGGPDLARGHGPGAPGRRRPGPGAVHVLQPVQQRHPALRPAELAVRERRQSGLRGRPRELRGAADVAQRRGRPLQHHRHVRGGRDAERQSRPERGRLRGRLPVPRGERRRQPQ